MIASLLHWLPPASRLARMGLDGTSTVAAPRSLRQRKCPSGHSRAKHGLHSTLSETTAARIGQRRRERRRRGTVDRDDGRAGRCRDVQEPGVVAHGDVGRAEQIHGVRE